jgi:hypothetical protein
MPRPTTYRRRLITAIQCLLAVVLTACTSGAGQSPGDPVPTAPPASTPATTVTPVPTVTATGSTETEPAPAGPPSARLSADGGDPVVGQLGTYIWAEGGSDSPWLPGAPIAVGAGEPLTVTLDPAVAVESWRARSVPSTADGPDGASILGAGGGDPSFAAPSAGSWTVEVHVVFAGGAGDANYFWRLEVA